MPGTCLYLRLVVSISSQNTKRREEESVARLFRQNRRLFFFKTDIPTPCKEISLRERAPLEFSLPLRAGRRAACNLPPGDIWRLNSRNKRGGNKRGLSLNKYFLNGWAIQKFLSGG
jgi:hypothetical protein